MSDFNSAISIIMYHYIRDDTYNDNINALSYDGFRRQLDFLCANYNIITFADLLKYKDTKILPKNACMLSFDDGYKEHYTHALPELLNRGLQGFFFPPVKPIQEREALDVNKIHYILAGCADSNQIVRDVNNLCKDFYVSTDFLDSIWNDSARISRYDCKQAIYVKRLLQRDLPFDLRNKIVNLMFTKYVGTDQFQFAEYLYMSHSEAKELVNSGMYVGGHGDNHLWMNMESEESQDREISATLSFLNSIGSQTSDWIMCYPYGSYNNYTISLLENSKCAFGLTTRVGIANLESDPFLELPRLNTNDFPK